MPVRDLLSAASGVGGASDPDFEYNTLLLNGDGTNGAQNNTFLDSSTNNFTITRNGNTTQGSFSPYGSNWSNYFDGSGDYLSTPNSANLVLNASDFTVECWVNVSTLAALQRIMVWSNGTGSDVNYSWTMDIQTSGIPRCYIGSFGGINASGAVNIGGWNHIAIVRSGSAITVYLNGKGGAASSPSVQAVSDGTLTIGADRSGGSPTTGYISNIRILKGTALYTTNFTPPTAPLTAITNTQLLTCQSNRFIDNSTNNFALTVSGNTAVQRFSPFNPTAPYSTSVIGGSGYFDGSGDYLATPTTSQFAPSGNFTIGLWYYPTTTNTYQQIIGNYDANASYVWIFEINNGTKIDFYMNGATVRISAASVLTVNAWNYIALARSGTTITGYVNGVSVGTYTQSGVFGSSTRSINIGRGGSGNTTDLAVGYISDVFLVDGQAITTVPATPSTAISGTSLLTNFTNAGIPDLAMQNNLETVGNAQVSTSVKKYGTGSLAFDGSGDFLRIPDSPNFELGSGNFTIEAWIYPTATGYFSCISAQYSGSAANSSYFLSLGDNNRNFELSLYHSSTGTSFIATNALTLNTWQHTAVVRNGNTVTLYVNGTSVASGSFTQTITNSSQQLIIGAGQNDGTFPFNGYIDDFRITKGLARYTANFTPPTAALPTF